MPAPCFDSPDHPNSLIEGVESIERIFCRFLQNKFQCCVEWEWNHVYSQAFSEVLMDSECFFVVKVKKNSICIPCHTETLDSNPFKNFFLLYLQASFMLQCSLP
ncbi:unnamed protein product [Allacma fusca]|uniref:Uncharacterized protein n=1 Tax=Allacma fusca TaxID=39272 RepID=A0A8J2JQV1_9HEXA|nr:unnamed protein product [Allacma fusca]